MLKTEADPLELIRDDLAIQLEDDVAELAESEAIRSNVRQSLDEVKHLFQLVHLEATIGYGIPRPRQPLTNPGTARRKYR